MEGALVTLPEFHAFVVRCMRAAGIETDDDAGVLADLLVSADYRGHYSHGLNRLDMYIQDVTSGLTATRGSPTVVKETVATALVDGNNVLGPVVGRFCTDLAIEKAKTAGIGWVSARHSNHFGIAGWYGLRALEHGMVGMAFTNTSPLMYPTRGKEAVLGTNPICVAAPAKDGDSFVLDMATTSVAFGKVELADRVEKPIPEGWALDAEGRATTDPKKATGLCPLGGTEETSGYKGYGLGMMVEIFCGIMSGSLYGHHVRKWKEEKPLTEANLGQCFVAINPAAFEDGFEDRLGELIQHCRSLPMSGEDPVLIAGDPERIHMAKCDKQGGILYHPNQIQNANEIASRLNVAPMKTR
ncbi:uncharacterized oxidoreductase YjmC-like [Dreissena polymorpha]|uniref:Malate dehydrogenase n=1 Tax=Dreissena polymorpha TaxID=45954 RepID=A0A9D3Y5U9_DREPO|nr:uncharacterized oxidoreductase YjmC-like [Dreissena polymorpha]KAH3692817.1 hypothetical protein DPMN_194570 [Dreissena polymorpha]